jgi:predicted RecB family nuclease
VTIRLSKSRFVAGCQCLKRLYLLVHEPELAVAPDAADRAIIEQGRQVGLLARQMCPGGVAVECRNGEQAIRATRELIRNPQVPAIFEAAFEYRNVFVRVDVLERRQDQRWRLIEVKSSTDVRDQHLEDVAIQYRVATGGGLNVAACALAHVNRDYVYQGGSIEPQAFFKLADMTRQVANSQSGVARQIGSEFRMLSKPAAPQIAPGQQCSRPVTCEFYDRCNPPRPHDHIGFLPRIHASAMEELEGMGVESIRDIPADFELTEFQRRAATCVQTGEPWFDRDGLKAKLETLIYPVVYLDCETINPAIPRFTGTRPYQQIPFQWSGHIQHQPGTEPLHYEFLASDASDPRRDFVTSVCAALPEEGSIVVYNQQFESARFDELAAALPEFADRIENLQARFWDLLPVVRKHVYHPAFAGSYSLKSVLPALIPGMGYDAMEVADGEDAGLAWERLIRGSLDQAECERIRKALLAYCGQDTLAMLRLLDRLRILAGQVCLLTFPF